MIIPDELSEGDKFMMPLMTAFLNISDYQYIALENTYGTSFPEKKRLWHFMQTVSLRLHIPQKFYSKDILLSKKGLIN